MFKVNNKDTRKTLLASFWCLYNFEYISHLVLKFLKLTLNMLLLAGLNTSEPPLTVIYWRSIFLFAYEPLVIIRTIMEQHRKLFRYFISYVTDTVRSPSIFLCVMIVIVNLVSYEIINESYFYTRHKNRRKHSQHFKLLFFTINSHFVTSDQYIENEICLSQAVFILSPYL